MVLSLSAVVGVILALAWMTRRLQGLRANAGSELKVKATLAVGMKERVVLIEAAGRQFLIGVAPGQVRLIESLGAVSDVGSAGSDGRSLGETQGLSSDVAEKAPGFTRATTGVAGRPSFREAFAHQLGQLIGR